MSKIESKKRLRKNSTSDSDDHEQSSKKILADGFDDSNLGDAKDRAWLKTLSEREREAELLKRHEQREALRHREEISKKLKSRVKQDDDNDHSDSDHELKPKSNEFDSNIYADDDDNDYPSSINVRKQTNSLKQQESQHGKSLKALVEQRKKKSDDIKNKSSVVSSNTTKISKTLSANKKLDVDDVFSTSESEDETNNRKRSRSPEEKEKKRQEQEEAKRRRITLVSTKSQLKPIVLSRFRLEKWCHASFFAEVVKDAFVRINIGQNNGRPVYRICEIRGVVETAKVYNLDTTRTNKGLRLKHGRNERVFRLKFVSNTEMSDSEFQVWRETSIKYNIPLPTLDQIDKKKKMINKYKNYVFSNKEISSIVEQKQRFRQVPINYAMKKQEILKDIEIAKEANDIKKENELKKKLDEMEARASELDRIRTANNSILAQINQRNRKRTQQNVEHALVREAQDRNISADPFTRRRCAPKLVSKAPQSKEELIRELQLQRAAEEEKAKKKADEQRAIEEQKKAKKTPMMTNQILLNRQMSSDKRLPAMTTRERGSFTTFTDNNDELFASHNFELDVVI